MFLSWFTTLLILFCDAKECNLNQLTSGYNFYQNIITLSYKQLRILRFTSYMYYKNIFLSKPTSQIVLVN